MTKFVIKEETQKQLVEYLISEAFVPKADMVLQVRDFLNKNFKSQIVDDVENGFPKKVFTVAMLSSDGVPLKTMRISDLLLYLDDKFNHFIKDDNDRKKFLKQVITDWLNNKISKEGILTKNYL